MLNIIAIAPLALGLAAVSPATAQTISAEATGVSVSVSYADLDLSGEKGRRVLDARVNRAAKTVCGGRPDIRNLTAMAAFNECMQQTKQGFAAQRLAAVEAAEEKRVAVLTGKLNRVAQR